MQVSKTGYCWLEYHRNHSKINTVRSYEFIGSKFLVYFEGRDLKTISTDDVLSFLDSITEGTKQYTRRSRYSYLTSFFNFIKSLNQDFQNPCDCPMMRKLFKAKITANWRIIDKDALDEINFRTTKTRNHRILELMSCGVMRISEVLNLTPQDVNERKLDLMEPKSGKEQEVVYIPQKTADRLKKYIRDSNIEHDQRIFPITYGGARVTVKQAGNLVGIHLTFLLE